MWAWLCCRNGSDTDQIRKSRKVLLNTSSLPKKQSTTLVTQSNIETQSNARQQDRVIEKRDTYSGEELDGKPHGIGTMNYVNGDYYKGEWVNGVKQGKGEHYYFELRIIYNGQWKNDMKNGNGHEKQPNGSWYEGQFKDGVRQGKGIYFDKQLNLKFSEIYINGKIKQRKQIGGTVNVGLNEDQFPTLKLDKERFNSEDLIAFEENNPEIKELDLDFLLKYYGLRRVINLEFIDNPMNEWGMKQVLSFLQSVGLEQYKNIFFQNKIKGKDLGSLDEQQMKDDLKMKLGDRRILSSYIHYLSSLTKNKKKEGKTKQKGKKNMEDRRGNLSVKKKKQNLFNSLTRSIQYEIIQQNDQWNIDHSDESYRRSKEKILGAKNSGQFDTENWDMYQSKDIQLPYAPYHSQSQIIQDNDPASQKTEKGSVEDHGKQIDVSPTILRRKLTEDKQMLNPNSDGENQNKKEKSSTSSQSSDPNRDEQEMFKIKRKKTTGPSLQIRQLYEFLKQNQSLEFIIKQKDIEIIQVIGQGGYGKVSRGRYIQCPVAVKDYMKAGRCHKSRQQFMKEVHILSDLKHPNIVLYMGLCITVNRYQLVTQYMENGSLYDQIHIKKTKFSKEQQLEIIDDIVQGMVYLHNMKNMLHRDLKSSNVLMAEDYKVKLCDFGLSGHKSKKKKEKKNRIGTYQWMAPQVIRNQQIDFFSDVYSFGVILWQILTQTVPYSGMSQTQIIGDVGYDKNHRLPSPPKQSDQFIISIMQKCLNRDTTQRPTFIEIQRLIKEQRKNRPILNDVWNIL